MDRGANSRSELTPEPRRLFHGAVHGQRGQAVPRPQRSRKRRLPGQRRPRNHDVVRSPLLSRGRHSVPLGKAAAAGATDSFQRLFRGFQPGFVPVGSYRGRGGFAAAFFRVALLALLALLVVRAELAEPSSGGATSVPPCPCCRCASCRSAAVG